MMTTTRLLLAVEASGRPFSLALFEEGRLIAEFFEPEERRHSRRLLPEIDALLKSRGRRIGEVDALAVTRGPGSFTSVRISLATVLGLGYPLGAPVYAVNSLEILAEGQFEKGCANCLTVFDARRGDVYAGFFLRGETQAAVEPCCLPPAALAALVAGRPVDLIAGEGAPLVAPFLSPSTPADTGAVPLAAVLGRTVLKRLAAGVPLEPAEPMYLRKSEAEENYRKKEAAAK